MCWQSRRCICEIKYVTDRVFCSPYISIPTVSELRSNAIGQTLRYVIQNVTNKKGVLYGQYILREPIG